MSRYVDNSREFLADLAKAVDFGLGGAAQLGADSARDSMPDAKAKGLARRGPRGRLEFTPSPPGTPPGVRRGRLRGSIASARIKYGQSWAYGTNVEYARIHEYGGTTKGGNPYIVIDGRAVWVKKETAARLGRRVKFSKPGIVPPRPFLRPALVRSRGAMEREFIRLASRSLGRSVTARVAGVP